MKEKELSYGEDDEFEIYLTQRGLKFYEYLDSIGDKEFQIKDFEKWLAKNELN